jgi:hypothetical protein
VGEAYHAAGGDSGDDTKAVVVSTNGNYHDISDPEIGIPGQLEVPHGPDA